MSLYRNKYQAASSGSQHWDYHNAGAYFMTICSKNREYYFGKCNEGEMYLNAIGETAADCWEEVRAILQIYH